MLDTDTEGEAGMRAALDAVLPLVRDRAAEAEAQGFLTGDVVQALRDSGLYTLMVPGVVGGGDAAPTEGLRAYEALSHAHASAGWCVMANNLEALTLAAYVEDGGIEKVFGKGADITIAGNGVPRGFARPVEGGWMIKGRWAYGSNIHHAEWIHTGCFVTDQDGTMVMGENGPKIVITHHPRDTIKLLGNWDVLGLRATDSQDYTLADGMDELFIPADLAYDFDIAAPRRGGPKYALGLAGFSAMGHTGWALGVTRRILDELGEVIRNRTDAFGKSAESASFKLQYALAEAKARAARALAYQTWTEIERATDAGRMPSLEEMTMVKLTLRHVHDVASEVGTFAHRASRGAGLHDTVLQRCFRDIHAGTQHILLADQIVEECGRALLGLAAPDGQWTVFGVRG